MKGDAGIEFIVLEGALYQCYAPEEVSDVKKAAVAQKAKAARDLNKLQKNTSTLSGLLSGLKVSRWILLCPFLDNKEVVEDVRKRGIAIRALGLPFLASDFEALVHSQDDFTTEIAQLRQQGAMPLKIDLAQPVAVPHDDSIASKLTDKLIRLKWSYYLSLLALSIDQTTNHAGVVIYDEPGQQEMKRDNLYAFLADAAKLSVGRQVIVSTSESIDAIRAVLKSSAHIISFSGFILQPLNDT